MEIERKYRIDRIPFDLENYPSCEIEQAYLNTDPVIRVRRQDDDYYLTYKSKGFMAREEYNLPLNAEAYHHLLTKADGNIFPAYKRPCVLIKLQKRRDSTEYGKKIAICQNSFVFHTIYIPLS